jgi:hypothetical protein
MKKSQLWICYALITLIVFTTQELLGNDTEDDPLGGRTELVGAGEIVKFWIERDAQGENWDVHGQIYNYLSAPGLTTSQRLSPNTKSVITGTHGATNNHSIQVATGDFTGDGLDNIVAAWRDRTGALLLYFPEVDTTSLAWTSDVRFRVATPMNSESRIIMTTADVSGNGRSELLLAFTGADSKVHVQVYGFEPGSLQPSLLAANNTENAPNTTSLRRFALAASSMGAEAPADIFLTGIDGASNSFNLNAYINRLRYNASAGTLLSVDRRIVHSNNEATGGTFLVSVDMGLVKGDLDGDFSDELVFGFSGYLGGDNTDNLDDTFLYPITADPTGDALTVDLSKRLNLNVIGSNNFEAMSLSAGDVTANDLTEIVLATGTRIQVFTPGQDMILNKIADFSGPISTDWGGDQFFSHQYIAVRNLVQLSSGMSSETVNETLSAEIVSMGSLYPQDFNADQYMNLAVHRVRNTAAFGAPPVYTTTKIAERNNIETKTVDGGFRTYAVAIGDFIGNSITVGKPIRYVYTEFVQPMVQLNAPPVHFDVINETVYDVNRCFAGVGNCNFRSTYEHEANSATKLETTFNRDWGVGASVEVGKKIFGVGATAKLETKYGEKFSRTDGTEIRSSLRTQVSASSDDQIYATIVNYDIWEYPVYRGKQLNSHIIVMDPKPQTDTWLASKSPEATTVVPQHEVGNILSYREYVDVRNNPNVLELLVDNSTSFQLSNNSSGVWELTYQQIIEAMQNNERSFSIEASASVSKWGVTASVSGNYAESNLSTFKTAVSDGFKLTVNLGSVDFALGETYFVVQPYAYWADNGSLVVDYAVRPSQTVAGQPAGFWSELYGTKPDPALIMPWRFDTEKGFNVPADRKLQTKSISFSNNKPEPGDVIEVRVNVHNFSLIDSGQPVNVRLYMGDPDQGGLPIESLDGQTLFNTGEFIRNREMRTVRVLWEVPGSIQANQRIYAVLDPAGEIDEIHLNNNKGFTVLNAQGTSVSVEREDQRELAQGISLSQNYPNPFNPGTTITFGLAEPADVKLEIYDIMGRKVSTLIDAPKMGRGEHQIYWSAGDLASGIYLYKLVSGKNVITRKMMLLK